MFSDLFIQLLFTHGQTSLFISFSCVHALSEWYLIHVISVSTKILHNFRNYLSLRCNFMIHNAVRWIPSSC